MHAFHTTYGYSGRSVGAWRSFLVLALLVTTAFAAPRSPIEIKDEAKRKVFYEAMTRAQALAKLGKWEESRKAWRKVISAEPDLAEGHQGYQDLMLREGRVKGDLADFRKRLIAQYRGKLKRQPGNPLACYLLGRIVTDLGEKKRLFDRALKLDPRQAWVWYGLGHLYEREGKFKEAEAALERAIKLRPKWAEGRHALGFVYMRQGKDKLATHAFLQALRLDPRYVDSMVNLALIAMRKKNYDEAVRLCRVALRVDRFNAEAWNNLGKAYYAQGRFREAIKAYEQALKSPDVNSPEVHHLNLGFCYYKLRDWKKSGAAFAKAFEINPGFAYAYYCLAQVRLREKKFAEARKLVREAQQKGYKVPDHFLRFLRKAEKRK